MGNSASSKKWRCIRLMVKKNAPYLSISILFIGFFIAGSILYLEDALAAVRVTATVPGVCGNNIAEPGEQCDGTDLAGASCLSLGYAEGTVVCHTDCSAYIVTSCSGTAPTPPSGGGSSGGGGGGGVSPIIGSTNIQLSGRAYPGSKVSLMRDSQVISTTIAGPDANFEFTASNLNSGSYIFNVAGEDIYGVRSAPYIFPVSLSTGITAKITGIFIAPTLSTDKIEVKKGDVIKILGQSVPNSPINITINSEVPRFFKATSTQDGVYLANIDTTDLEYGDHDARARATHLGELSADSIKGEFKVGTRNVMAESKIVACPKAKLGDLNCDKRINLVDYSIMAFWYLKPTVAVHVDLNGDKKVNLVDFSIMAYNWTG